MKNAKFHGIAIAVIFAATLVLYNVMKPPPPTEDASVPKDHFIQIYNATWGIACNDNIKRAIAERTSKPLPKDEAGVVIPQTPLVSVSFNNVLSQVSDQCNGKVTCIVTADSATLGVEPLESCFKTLELGYRCYNEDRLRVLNLDQGKTETLDCHHAD